ncbi:ABC transporter ATP-binding protein [Ligilactobacillus cholophilus]|uniref:ABC transporter ATP-binding protein n=1 Tax=Ligilactobacillus cholophilus TaxID=3050131 RepID=UPI00338E0836
MHKKPMGKPVEKAQNFWGTTWRLLKYMKNQLFAIILVMVVAITAQILQINTPKILGEATTAIFEGVMKGTAMEKAGIAMQHWPIDFEKIGHILLIVSLMYIGSAVLTFIQRIIMNYMSQRTVYNMRKQMKYKMKTVPVSYYDTHSNGDIISRAINDMDNISSTLQQSLMQLVTSVVQIVGTLWLMLTISWKLTLIIVLTVPLSMIAVGFIAPTSQKNFGKQQKHLGLLNNQVEENYAGQNVIKSFNRENQTIEKFEEENEKLYQASWKAQMASGIMMPIMAFISNLSYVAVAIVGGMEVTHGQISLGNVQAMLQYTTSFSQPISQLANLANTIQLTIASAERVFQVLDEKDMTDDPSGLPVEDNPKGLIEFQHVKFGYDDAPILMEDYNLTVKKGEMTAIVGPTGAGKTTIINLLERFYDIKGGSIRLNGKDTRDMKREELRSHFAMVLQDTWLFSGTIWENLKYGREDATDEEILAAAKAAHVDDFVEQLPQGYQTVLDESASNISQGQRQLLTIARAFVANPEILILDEATSSVDTRTEIQIQHAMNKLLENRTSFVVAHRLSTIQDANQIIVMNHGSIVETGTHANLLKKNGFYADLYNSQFEGNVSMD